MREVRGSLDVPAGTRMRRTGGSGIVHAVYGIKDIIYNDIFHLQQTRPATADATTATHIHSMTYAPLYQLTRGDYYSMSHKYLLGLVEKASV